MNVANHFVSQARKQPEHRAIVTEKTEVSYGQLLEQSLGLAGLYRSQGLGPGDRVLVLLPMGIELYRVLIALFAIGAVAVFPDPSAGIGGLKRCCLREPEPIKGFVGTWKVKLLKLFLSHFRPLQVFPASGSVKGQLPENVEVANLSPDAPALLTFTSGSTGAPRGIIRTHEFLETQHLLVEKMLSPRPEDVDLISLPVFVLSNLSSGITSVFPSGNLRKPGQLKSRDLVRQIQRHGVNRLLSPPAVCERLLETRETLDSLDRIFTGGGPVFPDLLEGLSRLAPGAKVVAVYGSTEAEPIAHIAWDGVSQEDRRGMAEGRGLLAGYPIPEIQVSIEDGEILVAGKHVVRGYTNPEADRHAKIHRGDTVWHRTGDGGVFDERGRLWLLGRIASSDPKQGIFPFPFEVAARSQPGVKRSAFLYCDGTPYLFIEMKTGQGQPGAFKELDQAWLSQIKEKYPGLQIIQDKPIPMDRRHNSKVDYGRLRKMAGCRD